MQPKSRSSAGSDVARSAMRHTDHSSGTAPCSRTGHPGDEMLWGSGLRESALRWWFCYRRRGKRRQVGSVGKGMSGVIGREPELAVLEEFLDRGTPWLA